MDVDVTIGIVTWNARPLLEQLLESIYENVRGVQYEVLIVDNGSQDGTVVFLEKRFPAAGLIKNPVNEGVAPARNRILKAARGRYILSLDVDTTIYQGAVETLVSVMDANPRVAVGGPKLVYKNGSLQLSCRPFPNPLNIALEGTFLKRYFPGSRFVKDYTMEEWDHAEQRDVDWMYGACLIIRKDALAEIGLFDEKFFYLYEDIDFCYRAKKCGWRVRYIPEAVICHHLEREERSIFNRTIFIHVRSIVRYLSLDYFGLRRLTGKGPAQ